MAAGSIDLSDDLDALLDEAVREGALLAGRAPLLAAGERPATKRRPRPSGERE